MYTEFEWLPFRE